MQCEENGYVEDWLQQLLNSSNRKPYWEPLVDDHVVEFMKAACDALKQDTHVFVSAVESLEKYVGILFRIQAPIQDMKLVAICSILLNSKHAGGQSDLRLNYIEEYMVRVFNIR